MNDSSDHDGFSLPGYTLSTRLGAGGYGEVWLAQAPGGLTKAVKFIYGSFHEKRAEHELRALQRIKDLRHPFLLSLERIEVVDGRLVIVTELADSSLKDRFDQCQREGLPGVPREELLGYLHDAADALDFLSEKHSLQHLDVKPENLLLVAGHVKVADFGLVKDVGQSQASLVGGLTPLYSAPEVFQGNPRSCSDQYSLAVLYQEMLTGVLPFTGVTAAELTLQHLHDEPDLSPLPTADRYVLSRALSKDPSQRFASCSELIEALLNAENEGGDWAASGEAPGESARRFEPVLPERRATRRPGPVTEFFDEQIETPRRELSPSMLLEWEPPVESPPRCLPAVELSTENLAAQPTLIIGIGGMAGSVLKQLRARLAKQFGEEPLPAVQMLLLDSDPKAIAQALQGPPRTALKAEETLALPLRRPQEYREQSGKLMRWLSRRWLYNIPKSLRTEGLRPLGRLAFADHARQVVQRIRMSLAQATDAESVRASAERAGLPFGSPGAPGARVYLVASISGGTGSGMSLDVGYAVRTALDKAGVADAEIIGVLLHSAGHDPRQCDLSRVNAYAWLTEYNHFHGPGGAFPGDESCGLPALPAGKRAFDSAYLVDLGAGLDAGALEAATQSVAEYLYLDALTPAQAFFAECRRDSNEHLATAPLRTFTLQKIAAATDDSVERAASALSREVVLRWAGNEGQTSATAAPSAHDTNQLVQGAATLVSQLQLKLEGLASNARGLIEGQFGGDQQGFIDNLMTLSREDGHAAGPAEMVRIVDCLFASPKEDEDGAFVLQRPLEAIVSPLTMKLAGDLARWVLHKLDERQERLAGAQRAAQWLVDHLTRLETDGARLSSALAKQVAACANELRRANIPASTATHTDWDRAIGYFRMRVDLQAVIASSLIARRLLAELTSVGDTVAEFGRHLKHVASTLPRVEQPSRRAGTDPLAMAVAKNLAALTDSVDHQLQDGFINLHGGLFQTIMGNSRIRGQMLATLGQFARAAVEQLATRPDVLQSTVATTGAAEYAAGGAESQRGVPPELLAHGGLYRALAVVPDQLLSDTVKLIARRIGGEASVLSGIGHDIILCQEGWDLPLPAVAVDLIQRRRDYADFAARVSSRGDVAWTPLTAAAASFAAVSCDNAFADAMPTVTHVL